MTEAEALLRLQEIDLETMRLKKSATELPQHAKLTRAQAAAKKLQSDITKIVGQRKDLEMDIESNGRFRKDTERLVADAEQTLATTTDYRAIADVESRLGILAKRIEKIDFDANELVENLVTVERAEKSAREVSLRLDQEIATLTQQLKDALISLKQQLDALARERMGVQAQLAPETQLKYAKAAERFRGRGVEELKANKPSACRVQLQPSQYADLKRRHQEIDECPYCHRILVCNWH